MLHTVKAADSTTESNAANIDLLWMLICAILVFMMQAGFMCLESGIIRNKNNINVALKNVSDFGISENFQILILQNLKK
jgi:ammonia channel protein AmtB